jgi:Zn-dependent protease
MDMLTQVVIIFIVILLSMTLHEAMHAYTSYWLGDDTAKLQGRLTLNPIAHIDPFMTILLPLILAVTGAPIFGGAKPVPFDPTRVRYGDFGAALVGVAGPLTNFFIAFVAFGAMVVFGSQGMLGAFLQTAVYVNLGFFIFNMIPIPPLDGSRVLYAFAPDSARRIMEMIEQYGLIVIFAIIILLSPVISAFMLAAIGFFLDAFGLLFGVGMV